MVFCRSDFYRAGYSLPCTDGSGSPVWWSEWRDEVEVSIDTSLVASIRRTRVSMRPRYDDGTYCDGWTSACTPGSGHNCRASDSWHRLASTVEQHAETERLATQLGFHAAQAAARHRPIHRAAAADALGHVNERGAAPHTRGAALQLLSEAGDEEASGSSLGASLIATHGQAATVRLPDQASRPTHPLPYPVARANAHLERAAARMRRQKHRGGRSFADVCAPPGAGGRGRRERGEWWAVAAARVAAACAGRLVRVPDMRSCRRPARHGPLRRTPSARGRRLPS